MKETLELVGAINDFVLEAVAKSEDGKFSITELFGFSDNVLEVYTEAQDIDLIKAELAKMNEEDVKALSGELVGIIFNIVQVVKNLKNK